MGLAARWAGWQRRRGPVPPAPLGAGTSGVAFLPEAPDARLSVEAAFGADLDADPASWAWTDITTDVRTADPVSTRLGRGDESSTSNPAELSLTLDNRSGDYSRGGRSRRWPYIRQDTPVRARIDPGTGARTVLHAGATSWTPGWDSLTGKIPVVRLTASGTLRRLGQGAEPVVSPIRRYMENAANVVAYWPCEEGKYATTFPAAVGGPDIWWTGDANLASCTAFDGSRALPTTNGNAGIGGSFRTDVPAYTTSGDNSQSVRLLAAFPDVGSVPPDHCTLMRVWFTGGTIGRLELVLNTDPPDAEPIEVDIYNRVGGLLGTAAGFSSPYEPWGLNYLLSVEAYESGGSVFFGLNALQVGDTSFDSGSIPGTNFVASQTLGTACRIEIDPSAVITGIGFGHVAVLKARGNTDPLADAYLQLAAYNGEVVTPASTAPGRLKRVCTENGVGFTSYGGAADSATAPGTYNDYMGPQPTSTVLDILHGCELVERGVLWDGLDAGLAYTTRRRHENAVAAFTIDAGAGELADPFAPVDDDQRIRNRWTVSRTGGAEFTVEDTTGPLGTGEIKPYSDSLTISSYVDRAARDLADWLVHVGTTPGYRYPTLTVDLRATPRLLGPALDLFVGARVDIANLDDALSTFADETVSLTVEGIAWDIGPDHCQVSLTCSRFDPWRVDVLAADSGDTDPNLAVLDTDGSSVNVTALAGATSLTAATPSGPLWTTAADDFPLLLDVGGVQVRATACSGATSPQTFTVDPLPADRPVGLPVAVWNSPVLGL